MNNNFTYLAKSKLVKQEVSCIVILPPLVSVLCRGHFICAYNCSIITSYTKVAIGIYCKDSK